MKPTIVLAADHAGFQLKEKVKEHLLKRRYAVKDMGTHSYDDDDDYPEFIIPAAREVARHPHAKGIIFGGSGGSRGVVDGGLLKDPANPASNLKFPLIFQRNSGRAMR